MLMHLWAGVQCSHQREAPDSFPFATCALLPVPCHSWISESLFPASNHISHRIPGSPCSLPSLTKRPLQRLPATREKHLIRSLSRHALSCLYPVIPGSRDLFSLPPITYSTASPALRVPSVADKTSFASPSSGMSPCHVARCLPVSYTSLLSFRSQPATIGCIADLAWLPFIVPFYSPHPLF